MCSTLPGVHKLLLARLRRGHGAAPHEVIDMYDVFGLLRAMEARTMEEQVSHETMEDSSEFATASLFNGETYLGAIRMPSGVVCGVDFCDQCGDCLYCYGYDPCYGVQRNPEDGHEFIVYLDELPDFLKHHPDAVLPPHE
jgi:hypothetical protein